MNDFASFDGNRIVTGSLHTPKYGLWVADVVFADEVSPANTATLVVGNLSRVGSVFRRSSYGGTTLARIVGGYNGWNKILAPRAYANPAGVTASMVLGDLAIETGEQLGPVAERFLGESYVRFGGPASRTLAQVSSAWWLDDEGLTQVDAYRSSSIVSSDFVVTNRRGDDGWIEVASDDAASWKPGALFSNALLGSDQLEASCVRHVFTSDGRLRISILTAESFELAASTAPQGFSLVEPFSVAPEGDRALEAMRAIVRTVTPPQALHGIYDFRVVSASGSSATCKPVDTTIGLPDAVTVTLTPSILGESIVAPANMRVVVAFLDGNPGKPIAVAGDPDLAPTSAVLFGGTKGSARVDDAVGWLVPGSGGASWSPTDPGGGAIPIKITGGSSKLKVG